MKKNTEKSYFIRRLQLMWQRNYAMLIASVLFAALAVYTLWGEPDELQITEYTFEHELVTAQLDNTVIAFAADIHFNSRRMKLWQKLINALNDHPEVKILLLGGDMVNGNNRGLPPDKLLATFKQLKNIQHIYSIPGNHEYRWRQGGIQSIKRFFDNNNIPLLFDRSVILSSNGGRFNLIGLDFMTNPHGRKNKKRFTRLFRDDMLNVVLTHTPEDFPFLPEQSHLILAGHTHGGQIHIPLLGSAINPPGYSRKYSYGRIEKDQKTLLVTSGLGSAYTQARFCMKPEIVLITLKSRNKK